MSLILSSLSVFLVTILVVCGEKKMFSYDLVLAPYKLIFMLSEFAHPTCFIQCLRDMGFIAIMISFLGFHFFPLDRYDMKEILQVKDSAVLQVTMIKPLH